MKFLFKLYKLKKEYNHKFKTYNKFFEYAYDVIKWALNCDFKKGN